MQSHLAILTHLNSETLFADLKQHLRSDFYVVTASQSEVEFIDQAEQEKQHIDCLIIQESINLPQLAQNLCRQATLLPAVILCAAPARADQAINARQSQTSLSETDQETAIGQTSQPLDRQLFYHTAEVHVSTKQLSEIEYWINQAIAQFVKLSPACVVPEQILTVQDETEQRIAEDFIILQQRRLSEKLKERLGYLGVYYKREPKNFFRYLSPEEQKKFLEELKSSYRFILLNYFSARSDLNQKIDEFVNTAFFADLPVTQIVEIHMGLIDEFSKQLKLEGRGEEILLDYRLTLIDTISHLCEMYRRCIPRES